MRWHEGAEGVAEIMHEERTQLDVRNKVSVKSLLDILQLIGKVGFVEFGNADTAFVGYFLEVVIVEVVLEFLLAEWFLFFGDQLVGQSLLEELEAPIEYDLVVFFGPFERCAL